MSNITIWIFIVAVSVLLGILDWLAIYNKGKGFVFRLMEVWRHIVGFLFAAVIGYFFLEIRWPQISSEGALSAGDYVLAIVFLMGALGWIPHFIKNITKGINAILTRVLNK